MFVLFNNIETALVIIICINLLYTGLRRLWQRKNTATLAKIWLKGRYNESSKIIIKLTWHCDIEANSKGLLY